MSEMEYHKGKLKKLTSNFLSLEETAKIICWREDVCELSSYNDTWLEQLRDLEDKRYIIINEDIYELIDHKKFDPGDLAEWKSIGDNVVDFTVSFYNGAADLEEALDSLFEVYER